METIDETIQHSQRDAVIAGDLARLKSLAKAFPESLTAQEYANDSATNLVDLAIQHGHHDVAIHLMVAHGFEVSPQFDYAAKSTKGGEYAVLGCNEYFQTLEMLGNEALHNGLQPPRNIVCYELRNWANAIGGRPMAQDTPTQDIPQTTQIDPEFIRLAASGDLRRLVARRKNDTERAEQLGLSHPIRMLNALSANIDAIEPYCQQYLAQQVEKPTRNSDAITR